MKQIVYFDFEVSNSGKILDIGAGTGRYSVALAEEGYDVTAVELVKYNLGILKKKNVVDVQVALIYVLQVLYMKEKMNMVLLLPK